MQLLLELPDDPLVPLTRVGGDVAELLRLELACGLYREGHITVAQAAKLAGMHVVTLSQELTQRGIYRQIGAAELEQDRHYVTGLIGRQ